MHLHINDLGVKDNYNSVNLLFTHILMENLIFDRRNIYNHEANNWKNCSVFRNSNFCLLLITEEIVQKSRNLSNEVALENGDTSFNRLIRYVFHRDFTSSTHH